MERVQPPTPAFFNYPSTTPWTKIVKSVAKREDRTDLVLIVRDDVDDKEERFPVLSAWLTLRSPGLARAIAEQSVNSGELVLRNVSPRILRNTLHFIRVGSWEKRISNDEDLWAVIKFNNEYPSSGLLEKCAFMLKKRMKVENALNIWRKSVEFNVEKLRESSLAFILRNATDIFGTEDFLNITVEELSQLLENDKLNAPETDVLHAVLKWGKNRFRSTDILNLPTPQETSPTPEQLRAIINPLIPAIRFPLMSPEALSQIVRPLNILTDTERLEIYDYVSAQDSKPTLTLFNSKPRVFRVHRPSGSSSMNVGITPEPQIPRTLPGRVQNGVDNVLVNSSVFHQIAQRYSNRGLILPPHVPYDPCIPLDINMPSTTRQSACASTSLSPNRPNPRKRGRTVSSGQSNDSIAGLFYDKQNCSYHSWEEFVEEFDNNPENILHSKFNIRLKNVSLQNNYTYPTVVLRNLKKISLDLSIDVDMGQGKPEEAFLRFERSFDIRRYLFYRRSVEDSMDLTELWDLKTPINIVINGVTMLRLNTNQMELVIGFRPDAFTILSGIGKGEHLQKLCLMKADVPNIIDFPSKHLKEVLFYHVFALTEFDVKKFLKRCPSLESFCCWVICPWWENMKTSGPPLYTPTELDLTKDFVSGSKLKYLALCKAVLTLTTSPKQAVKAGVTELFLDTCFWEETFVDNFDKIFPNLKKCAFRQKYQKIRPKSPQEPYKSIVSVRLAYKILKLPQIEWIRIWGLNWNERYLTEVKEGSKKLRSSVAPIFEEEISFVQWFLKERCKISEDSDNFLLTKDLTTNEWTGQQLNESEPKEYDNGFWNLMDRLDYQYYKLDNFFKDYQCVQNDFHINLGLPP